MQKGGGGGHTMNLVELNENNFILKIKRVDREPSENVQKQVTK